MFPPWSADRANERKVQVEQGNTYRLLIGDGNLLFRRGLRTILSNEPDLHVADEAATLEEVVEKAQRQTFDLILLNAALISQERGQIPPVDTPTVLLTGDAKPGSDAIPRSASASEIVAMVRSRAKLARKNQNESTAADLSALAASTRNFGTFPGLTVRESEIVRLLAENLTAREVAAELGLSIKTVEAHKLNVMRKLGLHDRASLIRFAAQHGVLSSTS
jgi:two-component system, NarL family, response regulator NreC